MRRALLALWARSLRNRLVLAVRGMKDPRRLIGAILGGGYLLWIFASSFGGRMSLPDGEQPFPFSPEIVTAFFSLLVAPALLLVWLPPGYRLFRASKAEAHWFLQLPARPRLLIDFYLIRDQVGLLLSACVSAVFLRFLLHASWWRTAIGMWAFLSLMTFHSHIAAALRYRLRRRWGKFVAWAIPATGAAAVVLGPLLALDVAELNQVVSGFDLENTDGSDSLGALAQRLRDFWPVYVFERPGRWILAPVLGDRSIWSGAALSLGILAAHLPLLRWVAAPIAQEAVLAAADAHQRREEAMKGRVTRSHRGSPWPLQPTGSRLGAFVWKGLASQGRLGSRSALLIPVAVLLAACVWKWTPWFPIAISAAIYVGGGCVGVAVLLVLFSDRIGLKHGLARDLPLFPVLRTLPLRGRTIVLGEILPSVITLSVVSITLLWTGLLLLGGSPFLPWPFAWSLAIAGPLTLPLFMMVSNLLMSGLLLLWPELFTNIFAPARGLEATGQRILLALVQMAGIAVLFLPPLFAGILVGGIASLLLGPFGIPVGALATAGLLALEASLLLTVLERRFLSFDISKDLR